MSDLIIAIFVTLAIWTATLHEVETKQHIDELYEINSALWMEGENTTARLKEARKKKCK